MTDKATPEGWRPIAAAIVELRTIARETVRCLCGRKYDFPNLLDSANDTVDAIAAALARAVAEERVAERERAANIVERCAFPRRCIQRQHCEHGSVAECLAAAIREGQR